LTLREEHGLRAFEKGELRKIFETNRVEVMGGWRKLHNKKLSNLYFSLSVGRMIK
jgi:hypothetical protein